MYSRRSLPVHDGLLRLGAVEHLLELGDAVPHARVHVRFGALDMVVEIVSEQLDVTDCPGGDNSVGEMTREKDESDVTNAV